MKCIKKTYGKRTGQSTFITTLLHIVMTTFIIYHYVTLRHAETGRSGGGGGVSMTHFLYVRFILESYF